MTPYRARAWHSTIVEDQQGRTVCAAASIEDRNLILRALNRLPADLPTPPVWPDALDRLGEKG